MYNVMTTFVSKNSFYIVVNGKNEIYHFSMSWEEGAELAEFYNSTIKDEGKFTCQEIDLRQHIEIIGCLSKEANNG